MLFVLALNISRAIAIATLLGTGSKASAMEAGACVKTIVLTRPIRRARDDATRFDAEERMLVTKKRLPSLPSSSPNLLWKK